MLFFCFVTTDCNTKTLEQPNQVKKRISLGAGSGGR